MRKICEAIVWQSTQWRSLVCCSLETVQLSDSSPLALSQRLLPFVAFWWIVGYRAVTTKSFIQLHHDVSPYVSVSSKDKRQSGKSINTNGDLWGRISVEWAHSYVNVCTFRGHNSDVSIVPDTGPFRGQHSVIDAVRTQSCWGIRLLSYPTNYDWNSTSLGYADASSNKYLAEVFWRDSGALR